MKNAFCNTCLLSPSQWYELKKAISELRKAMGDPAVVAVGDQTVESETIRECLRRVKQTKDAVLRLRDAGIEIDSKL